MVAVERREDDALVAGFGPSLRPKGSFEFTYAEIGAGTATVTGELTMSLDASYGQFCEHNYNQDGLVTAA